MRRCLGHNLLPLCLALLLGGCFGDGTPTDAGTPVETATPIAIAQSPQSQEAAEAAVEPEPSAIVFPEPWRYVDGSVAPEADITPYDVITSQGKIQLGLINTVSPKHVAALRKFFGAGGFTKAKIQPSLSQRALVIRAEEKLPSKLPLEAKPVLPTIGSLYFDGESSLLLLLESVEVSKEWNFVGLVILEKSVISAALSDNKDKRPVLEQIQGLSI